MKPYFSLLLTLLLWPFFKSAAQELPVKFLDINQGLSNNSVITIHQDNNSFMWFGTYDGLSRYDGYNFKVYRNRIGDPSSLVTNTVYCIQADAKNNIWVGGSKGACVLDRPTDVFIPLKYTSTTASKAKDIKGIVHQIKQVQPGVILAATQQYGLVAFNGESYTGTQIPFTVAGKTSTNYDVLAIQPMPAQKFCWVYIRDAGLCKYYPANQKLILEYLSPIKANCLASGANGTVWIGTEEGAFLFDSVTHTISQNFMPNKNSVTNILPEDENLWIATDGAGMYTLLKGSKTAVPYSTVSNSRVVKSNSVWSLYRDTKGNKWVGTLRGGISMIGAVPTSFKHIKYKGSDAGNLTDNFILSFCEDEKNNIWIGTDGAGLRYWNRKDNTYTSYNTASGRYTLSSNFITSIIRDQSNRIWLSTWAGGVNRINPQSGAIDYLSCYNPVTKQVEKNIWLVYQDSKKNIWASATNEGSLYKYNSSTDKFDLFDATLTNLQCLTETKDGKLWGGNYTTLFCIDPVTKKHNNYDIGSPVRSILEDTGNNLWIATQEGGLLLFDRKTYKFSRYTTENGLPSNTVLRLLQDKNSDVWMSTYNGLSRLDIKQKVFRNFSLTDGLQGNQFSFNAGLQLSSGEFMFGGINGFNIFNPEGIIDGNHSTPLQLASLSVNNKPIEHNPAYVTGRQLGQVKSIEIPFDQTTLAIEFVAPDYNNSDKISYAYLLEGWDEQWTYTDNIRKANYTRLFEGNYTFKVKTKNINGTWNNAVSLLHITVLPPWYRTWWAYSLYVMLFAGVIYAYIRYSKNKEKLRYNVKLAKMESNKEKELAEKQLAMFTYISHEFRTPLSLIINPLKKAVKNPQSESKELASNLAVAHRNARRLLSLVDQLLLFRKAESDADALTISAINVNHLCNEVYQCFVNQAKEQDITFKFKAHETAVEIFGDYEKIEIALFNLTSNSFKHTPAGGSITLELLEANGVVSISVIDTGSGIAAADMPFIFEKFRQSGGVKGPARGFGIGLFIVKYFTEKHSGTVICNSEQGKGSTFTLNFLKGYEHFADLPISIISPKMSQLVEELLGDTTREENKPEQNVENIPTTGVEILTVKKSILVIDDNAEIRDYLVQLFSPHYLVYAAKNGAEGLEVVTKHIPDLVISDISMDGIDGLEVCRTIKQNEALSHIPVILLTATTNPEIHLQGITDGADDYITKPFDADILQARVDTLLKSRENLRSYFLNSITLKENTQKVPAEYQEFLKKCIEIIEANLDDKDFTIKTFAKAMGMSHRSLYDKIKIISGQTLNAFIRSIRLRRAALLMLTEDINIAHASAQVGFEDQKYFRQQFAKLFGMNPSDYIKKYKGTFNKNLNIIR
ncbi:hybrid sensor histidine kinase/response regulator transcription factor [Flavobacterium subsaxonicum]|uniref:histidine kinase n=1 Tax=Flavobacterium subsaxonicum WB 4.1-42 = DSM 21790 TaxID=1121898 RepID=A0A0A2MU27_9FLAO|nr:hybrid sensor histidine kinase/response regulator transcription factor [Flavobacterium subsaxonicum]KGO91710.1 histidine kinase [Flavobacterium subsaxonicum WB 4.1-42 = DSM 21790]